MTFIQNIRLKLKTHLVKAPTLLITLFLSLALQAQDVNDYICKRLFFDDALCDTNRCVVLGKTLYSVDATLEFYADRKCKPAWYHPQNLLDKAEELIALIERSDADGLDPQDYHYSLLKDLFDELNTSELVLFSFDTKKMAQFELLLTDAALHYANDLRLGKLNPYSLEISWEIVRDSINIVPQLSTRVDSISLDILFEEFRPRLPEYAALRKQLKGWLNKKETPVQALSDQLRLKPGEQHKQVPLLRERLKAPAPGFNEVKRDTVVVVEDDFRQSTYGLSLDSLRTVIDSVGQSLSVEVDSTLSNYEVALWARQFGIVDSVLIEVDSLVNDRIYDEKLVASVRNFQLENGLEPDGVLGPKTVAALNNNDSERLEQIKINLERLRWLPHQIGEQYLMVNLAGFYLNVYRNDTVELNKKVVVGKTTNATPVFSDQIRFLELNPYWSVPYSIASREILPKLKRNPAYLQNNDMKLYSGGKRVNPFSVDWSNVRSSRFPYSIKQMPGNKNALGRVKFMFPNRYSVYLHDTPSKKKFDEYRRAFSHGCVRLHEPFELAYHLLKDDKKWDRKKIDQTLERGKNKRINLDEPVPIYLVYWTCWVDNENRLRFQEDIYKRDQVVKDAFFGRADSVGGEI